MKPLHWLIPSLAILALSACSSSSSSSSSAKDEIKTAIAWQTLNNGDEFRLKGTASNGHTVDVTFVVHVLQNNREEFTSGEFTVTYAAVSGETVDNYVNPGTIIYTPRRNANTANLVLNMEEQGGGTFIATRQGTNATLTWDPGMTTGTINFNGLGIVAGETFTSSNDGALQKVQFEYKRATPDSTPSPTVTP